MKTYEFIIVWTWLLVVHWIGAALIHRVLDYWQQDIQVLHTALLMMIAVTCVRERLKQ